MHFQRFWEQYVRNLEHTLPEILGLQFAERNVGNIKRCTFINYGTPVRRTTRRKSQIILLSGILGLLCAEQHVGNMNKCTFRNSRTLVRRTKRWKYQQMNLQNFWDSGSQHRTSGISTNTLSVKLGLRFARQSGRNLKKSTFKNYGTPVRIK